MEIAAALIAAAVAIVVFGLERAISAASARRERQRIAFGEVIETITEFALEAHRTGDLPKGSVTSRLVAARARLDLSLKVSERSYSIWLAGIERQFARAARAVEPDDGAERTERIDFLVTSTINTLLRIRRGDLTKSDMLTAAAPFWIESEGHDLGAGEFDLTAAIRPLPRRTRFQRALWWLPDRIMSPIAALTVKSRIARGRDPLTGQKGKTDGLAEASQSIPRTSGEASPRATTASNPR